MILRSLPNLSSSSTEFARWFHARWGCENCVIWGRARQAEFGPCAHTLSIRAAWGGAQFCHVAGRTLAVDDDNFLILNHGRIYSTSICATQPVESLTICFRPGLAESAYAAMAVSIERAVLEGDAVGEQAGEFMENLQPHDRTVTPVLAFIKAHVLLGVDDEAWYEEQLLFLLERMRAHRDQLLMSIEGLRLVRAATRREIYRRIGLATDFLHTNYAQPVELAELAKVAFLSKYHFLRLFKLVHGLTPFDYLQRKRTCVALRLLQSSGLPMNDVAARVGFARRATLAQQIKRWTGRTVTQIRTSPAPDTAVARSATSVR
jgi:AraC family transcriptional regulator